MRTSKVVEKDGLIFVGQLQGCCIKLSIPATSGNEWTDKNVFLDLPLMDKNTFDIFVEAIVSMKEILEGIE